MTVAGPELVAAPRPARVTFALLASLYDVLPVERRRTIYVAGVTWSARGPRVESSPVAIGSAVYRAVHGPVVSLAIRHVEIPEDATRCRWCGCVEMFACPGGCGWVQLGRCSECLLAREAVPSQRLAPGAMTPAAAAAAVALAELEARKRRGRR